MQTTISLADLYERMEPWDFSIEVERGEVLRVRRLTNADMRELTRVLGGEAAAAEKVRFLQDLFEDPKPDVLAWDQAKTGIVVSAVVAYYREAVVKKKAGDAAAAVAAHVATMGTATGALGSTGRR